MPRSGPGPRLIRRSTAAAAGLSARYDQENTARTSEAGSAPATASSVVRKRPSSSANADSGRSGRVAARPATTARAIGRRAQRVAIRSTASGSAATRRAPEPADQQVPGLAVGEQVDRDRHRPLDRDERGQRVAAGDHDQAAGRGRQQRPDLLGVAGVVQQDEHPPTGELAAQQGREPGEVGRDALGRHAERVEEAAHGVGRRHRRVGGVEAAQVDVQLPVGEPVGDPVGPVHGQRGLPDTGRAGDHGDEHGAAGRGPLRGQQRIEPRQLTVPAGERANRQRNLRRYGLRRDLPRRLLGRDGDGGGGPGRVEVLSLAQHRRLELTQGRPGLDAEVVAQGPAEALEGAQGVGLAAHAVQGEHELPVQLLVERVLAGQLLQLGQQLGVVAEAEPGREQRPLALQPQLPEPLGLLLQPGHAGRVGHRLPAPQVKGALQIAGPDGVVAVAQPGPDEPLGNGDVGPVRPDIEDISRRPRTHSRLVGQCPA
ncbi:hypothetical protein GCM10020218_094820 [Dactylosporangium vinaceum]